MFVGLIVGHSGVFNISYNDKTVKANTMIVILAAKIETDLTHNRRL